jgi:hypothetical protein
MLKKKFLKTSFLSLALFLAVDGSNAPVRAQGRQECAQGCWDAKERAMDAARKKFVECKSHCQNKATAPSEKCYKECAKKDDKAAEAMTQEDKECMKKCPK